MEQDEGHGPGPLGQPTTHGGPARRGVSIVVAGIIAGGIALVVGVGSLGIAMSRGVGQGPSGEVDPGFRRATDFTLRAYGGREVTLSDHGGGPVLVYFWASWCTVCEKMSPLLQRVWPEYERRGYTFLGVNILDAERDAIASIERHGMTFPNLRDEGGAVYLEYGVYGVPEFFFLRPSLEVDRKWVGGFTEDRLREMLNDLATETAIATGGVS